MREYIKTGYYLLFLLTSCHSDDNKLDLDFPISTKIIATNSTNLEELGLLLSYNVQSFDSCFIFGNIRSENHISILNKQTHKVINTAYVGHGPNELIQFISVKNNDNKYIFADRVRGRVFELDFDEEYSRNLIFQFSDSINRFFSLIKFDSNSYIGTGMFEAGRFLLYNGDDNTYYHLGEYPQNEDIRQLNSYQKAALFAGTFIGVHPKGNKLISAYKGLLDFYSITSNKKLLNIASKYYHFPLFGIPDNNSGLVIASRRENITGFLSLSYNALYVYLLYSNTSFLEKLDDTFSSNIVLVFDWNGNPIKKYDLDNNLLSIDIDGDTLWGVSADHSHLYKYEL